MTTFLSNDDNLLIYGEGVKFQFRNGRYNTDNPREIEYLRNVKRVSEIKPIKSIKVDKEDKSKEK